MEFINKLYVRPERKEEDDTFYEENSLKKVKLKNCCKRWSNNIDRSKDMLFNYKNEIDENSFLKFLEKTWKLFFNEEKKGHLVFQKPEGMKEEHFFYDQEGENNKQSPSHEEEGNMYTLPNFLIIDNANNNNVTSVSRYDDPLLPDRDDRDTHPLELNSASNEETCEIVEEKMETISFFPPIDNAHENDATNDEMPLGGTTTQGRRSDDTLIIPINIGEEKKLRSSKNNALYYKKCIDIYHKHDDAYTLYDKEIEDFLILSDVPLNDNKENANSFEIYEQTPNFKKHTKEEAEQNCRNSFEDSPLINTSKESSFYDNTDGKMPRRDGDDTEQKNSTGGELSIPLSSKRGIIEKHPYEWGEVPGDEGNSQFGGNGCKLKEGVACSREEITRKPIFVLCGLHEGRAKRKFKVATKHLRHSANVETMGHTEDDVAQHEEKVYFEKWVGDITRRKKDIEVSLLLPGLYSEGNEGSNKKEEVFKRGDLKEGKGSTPTLNNGNAIYERLCSGIRFFEIIIPNSQEDKNDKIALSEEKKELLCLCGEKCAYTISEMLQQISIFFVNNKREKVILSFLQNGDSSPNGDYPNNSITELNMHKLDIYIYLYLRKCLKRFERDENYNVLYFFDNKERILNTCKYGFNVDHFEIREWVFNNMSFLLPSTRVEEEKEEQYTGVERDIGVSKNPHLTVSSCRRKSPNLILSQQHQVSLFRLNSMINNENMKLPSKIVINKKLPNILLGQENERSNDNSYKPGENYPFCGDSRENENTHQTESEDMQANSGTNCRFIGHGKLALTEYVIDVRKEMTLRRSPFAFTKKELKYLSERSGEMEFISDQQSSNENYFYVVKIEKGDIENVASHIYGHVKKKKITNFVSILTNKFSSNAVFSIIKINLQYVLGA
ncbi:conserved Plasmodium protein, unknown function [Plasmodium ovale curtisi]|uniref:Uncharacterized protein n=1 Tax=Plasmodium ovale curtisi TaxID=864141 RepID=A0A1A8W3H2_PLAOA|nr:conserved Plasmodium protein, unknown function [Plasmodium ovale curtisi]